MSFVVGTLIGVLSTLLSIFIAKKDGALTMKSIEITKDHILNDKFSNDYLHNVQFVNLKQDTALRDPFLRTKYQNLILMKEIEMIEQPFWVAVFAKETPRDRRMAMCGTGVAFFFAKAISRDFDISKKNYLERMGTTHNAHYLIRIIDLKSSETEFLKEGEELILFWEDPDIVRSERSNHFILRTKHGHEFVGFVGDRDEYESPGCIFPVMNLDT